MGLRRSLEAVAKAKMELQRRDGVDRGLGEVAVMENMRQGSHDGVSLVTVVVATAVGPDQRP